MARKCWGWSGVTDSGGCPAPTKYRIVVGKMEHDACGRHVGWLLRRMLVPGRTATVTMLDKEF